MKMLFAIILALGVTPLASADTQSEDSFGSTSVAADEMIRLTLPKNTEVALLVEYVSKRLDMNILYSDAVGRKTVTINSPARIPKSSLMGLLQSVLRMAGLTIVDAEQPGWKKIVPDKDLLAITGTLTADDRTLQDASAMTPVTQIFELKHVDTAAAERSVKPLLSKPGGNTLAIAERRILIVTDYAGNLRRIGEMIGIIDRPGAEATIMFVPIRHRDATELAQQVTQLLGKKTSVASGKAGDSQMKLMLSGEPRTNEIILICSEGQQHEALKLIEKLDVPRPVEMRSYTLTHINPDRVNKLVKGLTADEDRKVTYQSTIDAESGRWFVTAPAEVHERIAELVAELDVVPDRRTETYRLKYVAAERINRLVQELIADAGKGQAYKSVIDEESGTLIVTARSSDHDLIAAFVRDLDIPPDEKTSPIRFYQLMNTTASEVLATIQSLTGDTPPASEGFDGIPREDTPEPEDPNSGQASVHALSDSVATNSAERGAITTGSADPALTAQLRTAQVTVDPNTNTLIVIAAPEVQGLYERLIKTLDKRRPQVMIEVILATIDNAESLSTGVEASYQAKDGKPTLFSIFGISPTDASSGLALAPGVGFNGAVIDPGSYSVVVHALASDGNSKVVAAPRILANDNGTATLSSIAEQPYGSLDTSNDATISGFGGYASAGITITVTPHISEGDHLQLEYSVTQNAFTGAGGGGIPAPRQTNTVNSSVTIPDGHAVIVGGLTRNDSSKSVTKLPLLGDIPLLGHLFRYQSYDESENTMFVFIRPVILRDDKFNDLRYLSDRDLRQASLPANYPSSDVMVMQ